MWKVCHIENKDILLPRVFSEYEAWDFPVETLESHTEGKDISVYHVHVLCESLNVPILYTAYHIGDRDTWFPNGLTECASIGCLFVELDRDTAYKNILFCHGQPEYAASNK